MHITTLLATCFYVGYLPVFPEAAASIVALTLHFFLLNSSIFGQFIAINAIFLIGAIVSEKVSHQPVVIDACLGMWIALFLAPPRFWIYALGLLTYTLIGLIQPKPIPYIKKHIPGGLGTMLDDAWAGIIAFLAVQLASLFI